MRVFITGGAGYIGSHTVLAALEAGHEVMVFDDFSNSVPAALDRVSELTGRPCPHVRGDVCDLPALRTAMTGFEPDAIIHFAGLKAVGESVAEPLRYYRTNVGGTGNVLEAATASKCDAVVFSSSATVYGQPEYLPIDESHRCAPENPYGWSKFMAEQVIRDWCNASPSAGAALLRYFNPVGAHESGRIGEDPAGTPNNLMPIISRVAVGRIDELQVFGDDYDTPDGTGVRDYIHVVDLAESHIAALEYARANRGATAINVGTGTGYSVREMIAAFERASNRRIPFAVAPRRPGDVAISVADPSLARQALNWNATRGLEDMCVSAWKWQSENPEGYVADA